MKTMRDYLVSLGASFVLTLGVVLAQDQAPAVGQPPQPEQPAAAPAEKPPVQPEQPAAAPAERAPGQPAAMPPAPAPQEASSAARPAFPAMPQAGFNPGKAVPGALSTSPSGRRTMTPLSRRTVGAPGISLPPALGAVASPAAVSASAASATNTAGAAKSKTTTPALKFDNAPVDIILQAYAQENGKTLLYAPDAPKANITLKSQPDIELSKEEYLEAIEVVLSMNGIVLEPFGDKFVKVLARKTVRTDGIKIIMDGPAGGHPEKSKVVSQMIQLKAIAVAEAQKALEGFKKPDGLFQVFERTNSILVTDTQENVNRMMEIVTFIDQPMAVLEKVEYRTIRYAKAEDIKKRIEELVAESQKQTQQAKEEIKANTSGSPGFTKTTASPLTSQRPPYLTGFPRPTTPQPTPVTPNETLEALISDAEKGMIRGKVQIIADERTNQLIIITRPDNMVFFDQIIERLDIETLPEMDVEVKPLQFADAEEVSTMLNDFIGNATAKKDDKSSGTSKGKSSSTGKSGSSDTSSKSPAPAEPVVRSTPSEQLMAAAEPGKSKLGQLSKDNIKILADKRTNSLLIMGSTNDRKAIIGIIDKMDIPLDQVLIETVMLQVTLDDTLKTGIDWVRRVKDKKVTTKTVTLADGTTRTETNVDPDYLYGAGGGGGSGLAQNLFAMGTNLSGVVTSGNAGIEYLATIKGLHLDAIISASKDDGRTKVLSSPVLLTVNNKEASIEATDQKYMYKGMRYMGYSGTSGGGSYEPDIEQRDVGTTVKVTPRIGSEGNVMLTIEEKFEDAIDNGQVINGETWPTVTTRKLSADVSVGNGETIILGGLVKTSKGNSSSGIPILKDIPYIGKYLFGSVSQTESRSELLVFLTPSVVTKAEDMAREARRRKDYVNAPDIWTKGWSDSKLSDPVSAGEMKERLARKKDLEKAWREYSKQLEKQNAVDTKIDNARMAAENLLGTPGGKDNAQKPEGAEAADDGADDGAKKQKEPGVGDDGAGGEKPAAPTLKVERSVEVLKPDGADKQAVPADGKAPDEAPVPPEAEQPRKPWWRRMF